ncbi:MAG TPA: condensation domain-containing protein, partial [Jatrophihabitans sp.]|nr:condensation domain-containing protein [Jatrophihabitans sp.]
MTRPTIGGYAPNELDTAAVPGGTVAVESDAVHRDPVDSDSAPMTFGQLSVWRDITGLSRSRWHEANVIHSFPFPRPVSRVELSQVLTRLYTKHHSLRTVYDVDDPAHPRQRLLPPEPVDDVEVCYRDEADLATTMDELASRSFDVRRDRQLRVLAVSDGPRSADPTEPNINRIVLCVHHIACDGWSMGLLMRDINALLGMGREEVPEAEHSLLAIGQEQHSDPSWQRKLKATQRYFRAVHEAGSTNFRDFDTSVGALQVSIASRDVFEPAQALADS